MLSIENLYLENFRNIEKEDCYFDKGIIVFNGNNGEGKSTFFFALNILLFNKYEGNYKDYIKWGEKEFYISVKFFLNKTEYFTSLQYNEKTGSERIFKNLNTNEEWKNSIALEALEDILDTDIAFAAIVSNQNSLNFIETTPSKRREYLKSIYDLEFKNQVENIVNDLEIVNNDISALKGQIEILQSEENESYKEYKENILSESDLLKLQDEKEELIKKIYENEKLENEKNQLQSEVYKLKSELTNCETSLSRISQNIKDNQILLDNFDSKQANEKIIYQQKLEALDNSLTELKLQKENIVIDTGQLDNLNSKLEIVKENIAIYKSSLSQTNEKLEILRSGICPTCGHIVTGEEVSKEENVYQELTAKLKSCEENYTALTDEKLKIQNKITELNNLNNIESAKENEKTKLIESYNNSLLLMEKDKKIAETNIQNLSENLKNKTEHKNEINNKIISLNEKLGQIMNFDVTEFKKRKNEIEQLVNEYKEILSYNKYVTEFNKEVDEKKEKKKIKIENLRKSLYEKENLYNVMNSSKNILQKDFPSFVINHLVKTLEEYVNEFLLKVYPKYKITIKETKNSLSILYSDKELDVKMASGFEKSVFSLAYMYALGKFKKYGLLCIDEGDSAASDENSIKFYETLAKSIDYFPQIFCITHKEEVKEFLKNNYSTSIYTVNNGKILYE